MSIFSPPSFGNRSAKDVDVVEPKAEPDHYERPKSGPSPDVIQFFEYISHLLSRSVDESCVLTLGFESLIRRRSRRNINLRLEIVEVRE